MKILRLMFILVGSVIQLSIDIIFGLTITFALMIIVYPFTFLYERLKVHYYELKALILDEVKN
jgi:hypothetical protein